MRSLSWFVVGAMVAQTLVPAVAAAQSREDRYALDACKAAVQVEVREQYPQAYGVSIVSSSTLPQGRNEVSVMGKGEFEDRNGGAARFDYGCVYDLRANRTYALDVSNVRPAKGPNDKKDNSAAIAGLVLGAIVIGALAASSDNDKEKHHDRDRDSWSPAAGVRCVQRDRACYEDGRYSRKWTNRIFVGR